MVIKENFKEVNVEHIRGDTFARIIFQKYEYNPEDPSTIWPGNLTGSSFHAQVRRQPRSNLILCDIKNDFFSIGQSQAAIDYDIAESNDPGTTQDQLYVDTVTDPEIMKFRAGLWYWDLQWTLPSGKVNTPIGGRWRQLNDVTRL